MQNLKDADLICYCIKISKKTIVDAIVDGNINLQMIKDTTIACTGSKCKEKNPSGKCCSKDIKELIKIYSSTTDNSLCSCCKN